MTRTFLLTVAAALFLSVHGASERQQFLAYRSFDPELKETRAFADMGLKLRAFGICNTYSGAGWFYSSYPSVWNGPGQYDWASLDRQVGDLLSASPDADFLCLIDVNSPPWLQRRLHFDTFDSVSSAACSAEWREAVTKWIEDAVAYCERRWGGRIKSYGLMAGQTTEWYEADFTRTSRVKNAGWRAWCAARGIDGGEAVPNECELARAAFEGVFYDPATEGRKIAFWKFHNGVIAEALTDLSGVAKRASGGKEIGAFFGYYGICNKNLASQGHLDYERVAASPNVDYFLSPATYTERACGFSTQTMTIPGTLRRHGKRFFHEIDFWPHDKLVWFKRPPYWHSAAETVAGNTRDAAYALVNHASAWWFDQKGGFYSAPGMHARIAKLAEIHARFRGDASPLLADVMFVADPDSAYGMVDETAAYSGGRPTKLPDGFSPVRGCGEALPIAMSDAGAMVDMCSFDDLVHLDLSRIRAFVLPATWQITPAKAEILRRYVLTGGHAVIWTYAPGVSDGKTLDVVRIETYAGVKFKTKGVATTKRDGWTSVYAYDYRELTPDRLREVLTAAGCHFWTKEKIPVFANERLFALHCKTGGLTRVTLPFRCAKVVDLLTGETVATDAAAFDTDLASPDTRLFEMVR